MKTLIALGAGLLCLSPFTPSPAVPDDEDCRTGVSRARPEDSWGLTDCHVECDAGSSTNCDGDGYQEGGGDWIAFCGCDGYGDEPECCHLVLRSVNMGPFEPEPTGNCGESPCETTGSTCTMSGSSTSKTYSCSGSPPQ